MKSIVLFVGISALFACNSTLNSDASQERLETKDSLFDVKVKDTIRGSFCEYTKEMLINKEHLNNESAEFWYGEYQFLKGEIISVAPELDSIQIRVTETSTEFAKEFGSLNGENWTVFLDQKTSSDENQMPISCSANLKDFFAPGRKIKFSATEAYPGAGTAMNGVWFLTYAKAID
jgi:hypothetical protein